MLRLIDMGNLPGFLGILCALPLAIILVKRVLEKGLETLKNETRNMEDERLEIAGRLDGLKEEKKRLERKLIDISKLYAITKEMSFSIRFNELLSSLKTFLEDNFRFEDFKIILLSHENEKIAIGKAYEIGRDVRTDIELDDNLRDLAGSVTKAKKPKFFIRNQDLFSFGFDERINNLLVIPLSIRRSTIAVILVENIKEEEHDNFLILASQVALQIERVNLFENVEKLSITDGLTGTFLRRYFMERMKEELERAKECGMKLAFIMADLDHFKECNDNLGHLVGDVVLKNVADILKKNVREIDLVGRYGGEEFSILLPEADSRGAHIVAERIRQVINNYTIKAYDESIKITISMGIDCFPDDAGNLTELIANADKALYAAKRDGRNKIYLASGSA